MPVSNLSQPILEAMRRRGMGENVGPVAQTNPAGVPATVPTPPVTPQGAGIPRSKTTQVSPMTTSATPGVAGNALLGGSMKEQNDARIIEALISYLRRKVL